jgi:succinate dehydrogenase/fumarate reductase iron-sulfur protein
MTCYIPTIDHPEAIYTVTIKRFDPEIDEKPYWTEYKVPFVKTMTVMEALEYLWDQGEYIAFRANCREFTCGSCAMIIDGKPQLACDTLLKDTMTLEPLSRYPVLKDLVVDTQKTIVKIKELKYWPETGGTKKEVNPTKEVLELFSEVYSRCIECYCCLEACPASASEDSKFDGPMHILYLARAHHHPLETENRVRQASGRGLWACASCFECADVCPVDLSPGDEVTKLRGSAIKETILGLFGRRKD